MWTGIHIHEHGVALADGEQASEAARRGREALGGAVGDFIDPAQ
jgi:hypothetical protein